MSNFLKPLDWSTIDIDDFSTPIWLENFKKHKYCISNNIILKTTIKLIELVDIYINPQNNFGRDGAVDENVVGEIEKEFKNPEIGFRKKEDPVVVFDFDGQDHYKNMLDMPLINRFFAAFCLHRHFAGNENHANVSHLPECLIRLPDNLSKSQLENTIARLARIENLEGQTPSKKVTWQDTSNSYSIELRNYKVDGRLPTAEQEISRLKELLIEDKSTLKKGWVDKIITRQKETLGIYKPIDKYTTKELLVDWGKNYDNSFTFRGLTLDNINWSNIGKPQQLFGSMREFITPLIWDNGAKDRVSGKLIQQISRDMEEKIDKKYMIFLTVNECKTADEIESDRKKFVRWVERQFNYGLNAHKDKVYICAIIPQNFHENGDNKSTLKKYEDYL